MNLGEETVQPLRRRKRRVVLGKCLGMVTGGWWVQEVSLRRYFFHDDGLYEYMCVFLSFVFKNRLCRCLGW